MDEMTTDYKSQTRETIKRKRSDYAAIAFAPPTPVHLSPWPSGCCETCSDYAEDDSVATLKDNQEHYIASGWGNTAEG